MPSTQSSPGCEFWEAGEPCAEPVVETLVTVNPLCGGQGRFDVCTAHLENHLADHLLRRRSA